MGDRTLIVAKVDEKDLDYVAQTFADSDGTELPHLLGVSRRTLFSFHGLYFHLVEADEAVEPNLRTVREHPLFRDINTRLSEVVSPYHESWREPRDAMAKPFYTWTR